MTQNWKKYNLGAFAKLRKENIQTRDFSGQKYIGLEHIGQGTFSLDGIGSSSDVSSNKSKFKAGDILYGKIRPYFQKVFRPDFEGICSTDIFVMTAKDNGIVEQSFLYQIAKTKFFTDKAVETSTGTKMPRADWNSLSKVEFLIPPLPEQRAIASILSALDDKIELNLQMNNTLEEMAMALYKHWFVDFGPFKDGKFVESELGMIPEGWEVKSIGDLLSTKPLNGLYKKEEFQGNGNRWLKMKSVYGLDFITEESMERIVVNNKEIEKYGCLKNDIVFGRTSLVLDGIGKCAIIKTSSDIPIFESNLFRLRFDKTKISPDLIFWFFKSTHGRDEVKKIARQTAAVSITSADLISLKIPIPNLEIQNKIIPKISQIIDLIVEKTRENAVLTKQRDTLLPKLISGEISIDKNIE